MSCVLRIWGENFDVDAFVTKVQIPFYQKYHKGEPVNKVSRRKTEHSGVTATTSDADFNDLKARLMTPYNF